MKVLLASTPAVKLDICQRDRLQLLVAALSEEQAERAFELLSPPDGVCQPQRSRQLPAFVGIGDSGRNDVSEQADYLLVEGFGE